MVTQPPISTPQNPDGEDFQLFHGRLVGRGRDIGILAIALVVYPLIVFLFWFQLSRSQAGTVPGVVYLTYWSFLLVGAGYVVYCIYNVLRPGRRRWVYGVNSKFYIKKFLRGENHPLWNATRAPAAIEADALWEQYWELSRFTVSLGSNSLGSKVISLIGTELQEVEGQKGKHPPLLLDIDSADFDDPRVFARLGEALQRVMPQSERALSAAAIVALLRGGVPPDRLEPYVQWLRGVNFSLDERTKKELREAGATDKLLDAISKAKR